MNLVVNELIKKPGAWLSRKRGTGIVISSRVRLARNLRGCSFPGWAREKERVRISQQLRHVFEQLTVFNGSVFFDVDELAQVDRDVLRERHLISTELIERGSGAGLVVSPDEQVAVMINEEDHLRLQSICPGFHLREAWQRVDALDSELEAHVEYAFSSRLGYLTACPSNVGTGLRASVMLHLCGLNLLDEIKPVINGLERLGLAVRGLFGEGSQAAGNMYQVSNQTTLGESEEDLLQRITSIVSEVVEHEENARLRLMESRETMVLDQVGRAYGILQNCRMLSSEEAFELLSYLRLGVEFKLVKNLSVSRINQLMLMVQPGHLQKVTGKLLETDERDELRSKIVHQKLRNVTIAV